MKLIGRGAEGEVFKGELSGESIAAKRVGAKELARISFLFHLNHPNLIQFL